MHNHSHAGRSGGPHNHSHGRPSDGSGNASDPSRRAADNRRRLLIALALSASYMVAEAIGGWLTGSLALLADAGHMLTDVFALAMSAVAVHIAQRPPNPRRTYGYQRTEVLAALGHGVLLVCISIYIFVEAAERIGERVEVAGAPMLAIAFGGLVVNAISLAILHSGRHENLNVRGAWLHVASDALGSIGAIGAGLAIWGFGWMWADTLASVLIGVMVIYSSFALMREALGVLMEGTPAHIDTEEVRQSIAELRGVVAVHDLHIWTVGSGMVSLSGHVVAKDGYGDAAMLRAVIEHLERRFGIAHATIQIEPVDFEEGGVCPE
jgi:cobalt-zinc-cadmium efflux system protein